MDCPGSLLCLLASSVSVIVTTSPVAGGGMAKVGMGSGTGGNVVKERKSKSVSFAFLKTCFDKKERYRKQ